MSCIVKKYSCRNQRDIKILRVNGNLHDYGLNRSNDYIIHIYNINLSHFG